MLACQATVLEVNSCSGQDARGHFIEAEFDRLTCDRERAVIVIHTKEGTAAARLELPSTLTGLAAGREVFLEPITLSITRAEGQATASGSKLAIDLDVDIEGKPSRIVSTLDCAPQGGD